ncbi:MAG: HRDC domain-containing protein [Desulfobacteraceae bacterium]|nr:HRDC domain-containing protein [Desulfobacteraceae bacterium]
MLQFTFIESDADLAGACAQLSKQAIIGVDLEADSMHSFKEKICLIQIATKEEAFLVDPFTIADFSPFVQVLENPAIIKVDNHAPPYFKKFKGAGKLDNRSLAVLENLLAVRMAMAEKKDVPLFKIMSNQSLLAMATGRPKSVQEMVVQKMLSKRQAQMYGMMCKEAIDKAMALPHRDLPSYPKTIMPRKTPAVMDRITALKKMREKKSISLGMEPGFLVNNNTITALAQEKPDSREALDAMNVMRNWQKDALGDDIIETLKKCN